MDRKVRAFYNLNLNYLRLLFYVYRIEKKIISVSNNKKNTGKGKKTFIWPIARNFKRFVFSIVAFAVVVVVV